MSISDIVAVAAFLITLVGTSWKLHSDISSIKVNLQTEISSIKVILERLLTKFEEVDKLEKRIDRLEKKVFHLDNTSQN
jgi:polyhydroxyalkanoate synthesis regulator phasin